MSLPDRNDPCAACPAALERREFLRDAAGLALGILVGLGLSPARAAALPIVHRTGRREPGSGDCNYPVPASDGATIDKEHQVILVRFRGVAYAFALSCPHQNTALRWLAPEGRFQCPKHKSQYQPDGTFITGRATRNMDRMPIHLVGQELVVDAEHVFESDKDAAGWPAAKVTL